MQSKKFIITIMLTTRGSWLPKDANDNFSFWLLYLSKYLNSSVSATYTPARTHSISGLKSWVLKLTFLALKKWSGIYFEIHRAPSELPASLPGQFSPTGQIFFCTGQQQLWRGSVNFKINSRPLFTIIFKLKNVNVKTQDFSPLIEWVLAGVHVFLSGVS